MLAAPLLLPGTSWAADPVKMQPVKSLGTFQRAAQRDAFVKRVIGTTRFLWLGHHGITSSSNCSCCCCPESEPGAQQLSALAPGWHALQRPPPGTPRPRPSCPQVTAVLRETVTAADASACMRLVLHDAGTYDIATGTGGFNGSIRFE